MGVNGRYIYGCYLTQLAALQQAGCKQIFTDDFDGVWKNQPGLEAALNYMNQDDVLVVWRLERVGRSFKQFVCTVNHWAFAQKI